jgi:hypothetical protein
LTTLSGFLDLEPSFDEYYESLTCNTVPSFTFYIPSKNRADSIITHKVLTNLGIHNYKVVVEPQNQEAYSSVFAPDNLVVMDKNDQGIAYVRNYIKQYSKQNNETHHWQLDDDIKRLYYIWGVGNKHRMTDPYAFTTVETVMKNYPRIGISGFSHAAFAAFQKKKYRFSAQCCTMVCISNDKSATWDPETIEDTDYSLQLLYAGDCTLLFNCYGYDIPKQMTQKGGNTEAFVGGALYKRQLRLKEKYPGMFEIELKDGTSRIKPSKIWSRFKHQVL